MLKNFRFKAKSKNGLNVELQKKSKSRANLLEELFDEGYTYITIINK